MLKRALLCLLLTGALCAAALPVAAVSLPWSEDEAHRTGAASVGLDLKAMSNLLASASASSFDGLRAVRPNSASSPLLALAQSLLRLAPWLGTAEAKGLWTWNRDPTRGVAIYGPGIGGYSSFSWTRQVRAPDDVLASLRNRSAAEQAALLMKLSHKAGAGSRAPTPVPLPPGAILLGAAIATTAVVRRRRHAGPHRPAPGNSLAQGSR